MAKDAEHIANIGEAVGTIQRELFLLIDYEHKRTPEQKYALNKSVDEYAKCQAGLHHNMQKAFED